MATEIAVIPLQNNKSPADANSPTGQAWKDCMSMLTVQDGFQRCYWGTEVENVNTLELFVDWDSVESHKKFMASPEYTPFMERFGSIIAGGPTLYHAHFQPHPATTALSDTSAPVTEVLRVYLPTSYSESDQQQMEASVKKLIAVIEEKAEAYKGSAGGWVDEEVDIPGTSDKAKLYIAVLGWSSVEAHNAFRDTPDFKDNIHHLRGIKDLKKTSLVHVSFTEIQREGGVGDPTP